MCVWFQEAVHVYRPERSVAENLFSIRVVGEWTHPRATGRISTSCDDICLDGYWCAAKGILMNVGHPEIWVLALIILASPICFGASIAVHRRVAASAFALWSIAILWGMIVSYSKQSQFYPKMELQSILLHTPFQFLFNILALFLIPALFVFALERAIRFFCNRDQSRIHGQ